MMRRALLRLATLWPLLATCPGARAHNVTGADSAAAGPWSFLVVADPHKFTYLAAYDGETDDYAQEAEWQSDVALWRGVREARGGDLVLIVGDTTSFGKFNNLQIAEMNGYTEPSREANYVASRNAARGTRAFFAAVGYPTVLAAVGDHEIGGNNWGVNEWGCATCLWGKYYVVPDYRRGLAEGYNTAANGAFLFRDDIGGVPPTPEGTEFNETSFAYVHKNALFVTVDAFHLLPDNYIDRELGYGGEGGVTCNVTGAHLDWFERILQAADDDPAIKHKFVQSHIPILHPVRKVRCSGQFMDGADKSDFWKVMNKYNVDIYFAGDVHSNTASVSTLPGENVVQVVTRANKFVGYTNLAVTEDAIDVTLYMDVGGHSNVTGNYHTFGRLTIDKSESQTRVTSEGEFALVDPDSAIMKFKFEEIFPLNSRGVPGLSSSWASEPRCPNGCTTIRDIQCTQSILNHGSFGRQYDAQVANIDLVPGPTDGELAAEFTTDSRFSIYGVGPYTGGVPVSFSMWIKTAAAAEGEMVLVHYGSPYNARHRSSWVVKTHMTLTLKDGALVLHVLLSHRLGTVGAPSLDDGDWHRIGVSMPRQSCLLSEIEIYIDGQRASTALLHAGGDDIHIFHYTSGRMALGGFGGTAANYEEVYPLLRPFVGTASGFSLWSSPLPPSEDSGTPAPASNAQANVPPYIRPSASPSELPSNSPLEVTSNVPSVSLSSSKTKASKTTKTPKASEKTRKKKSTKSTKMSKNLFLPIDRA